MPIKGTSISERGYSSGSGGIQTVLFAHMAFPLSSSSFWSKRSDAVHAQGQGHSLGPSPGHSGSTSLG